MIDLIYDYELTRSVMEKIIVGIKRVVDYTIKVRIKPDHSGIETANVKMSINPFDEIALEEAIRLKEKGLVQETIAISIGPEGCQESLRAALAMGMDRAIHVVTTLPIEPINVAKILRHFVLEEKPQLILLGKQAIDDDCNQTGQMLAALLSWPQATFASQIELEEHQVTVTREIDGGLEKLMLQLPAVITTDLRLNKPRYISLPNIMKAKQKKIISLDLNSLALALEPHIELLEILPPTKKKIGIKVDSVQELVNKLHEEAKVL